MSFRKLAVKYNISKSQAWEICNLELQKLPNNNQFTHKYCNRFSHIFMVDGKYFNIASERHNWVLLWGIDYINHDIPMFLLAPSENYQSWYKYFFNFKMVNHHPDLLVSDDNVNLKMAARTCFPQVKIQTCFNHFKENIRRDLSIRSTNKDNVGYRDFMKRIESILDSSHKLSTDVMDKWLWCLYRDHGHDKLCLDILLNIEKYKPELTAYRGVSKAPLTTNLIEGMNSHLETRLFALRSFQTIEYARLWFNGYILKRRYTKYTDCSHRFNYLNGKSGVEMTKNTGLSYQAISSW